MTRWLPYPLISLGILLMWLLLNGTLATGQVLIGCALGLGGALALTALEPPKARVRRPVAILQLLWIVLQDIVRSNIAVGRIILGSKRMKMTSGFVEIPLELQSHYALAALAVIVTATPGTLWVNFNTVTRRLTLHVLDLVDEETWVRTVKNRYERLLLEIFE
jgi:multicomponent K+:H+ antiporter subunit E